MSVYLRIYPVKRKQLRVICFSLFACCCLCLLDVALQRGVDNRQRCFQTTLIPTQFLVIRITKHSGWFDIRHWSVYIIDPLTLVALIKCFWGMWGGGVFFQGSFFSCLHFDTVLLHMSKQVIKMAVLFSSSNFQVENKFQFHHNIAGQKTTLNLWTQQKFIRTSSSFWTRGPWVAPQLVQNDLGILCHTSLEHLVLSCCQ